MIPTGNEISEYKTIIIREFEELLINHAEDERKFQKFFEENPILVPGSRGLANQFGFDLESVNNILISEPVINGIIDRKPDFMWLSYDSSVFCPVIIEIEAPIKPLFNNDGTQTAKFTKARNQLIEWKTILNDPTNQSKFYSDFSIPQRFRELTFEPQFLLIYGRRNEYWDDQFLTNKRKELMGNFEEIISYDRISPNYNYFEHITCKVKGGKYRAINISPLVNLSYLHAETLRKISNLDEAISKMRFTSQERKEELLDELNEKRK